VTHLLPWNQLFPLIQTSARVNKKPALQQVSGPKEVGHTLVTRLLPLSSGLVWGLKSFRSPVSANCALVFAQLLC
jgi:hypothetical protein